GQLMVSHGVPLCFFGEKKRTRTGSWPLLSYAPWVLQLLSEFAVPLSQSCSVRQVMGGRARALPKSLRIPVQGIISAPFMAGKKTDKRRLFRRLLS
ncbi:hypothetical protein RCE57_27440, partial [Klebsiella pneumoniae]|nr:hypothetical protein [Klebsiella pneumoniae]